MLINHGPRTSDSKSNCTGGCSEDFGMGNQTKWCWLIIQLGRTKRTILILRSHSEGNILKEHSRFGDY